MYSFSSERSLTERSKIFSFCQNASTCSSILEKLNGALLISCFGSLSCGIYLILTYNIARMTVCPLCCSNSLYRCITIIMVKIKKEKIPTSPGVYFFKDKKGQVLYVGKATSLKNRISSYFVKNNGLSPAKRRLLDEAATVTWEETPSEIEALLQESHYIKKYQPRFNVLLRDDKTYLSVKITDEEYPRVLTTRKIEKDGTYFGPFTDARAVKETLKILRRFFPYRTNCVDRKSVV